MKYPVELFVYEKEAHSVPVDAWRGEGDDGKTVRYLCSSLKCNDCKGYRSDRCSHNCPVDKTDKPACMAFVLATNE